MAAPLQKNLPVADLGIFQLSLSLLEFGSGSPSVLIINNLHGDELTGFFVLEKMLPHLPAHLAGRLTIITSANPLGLIHRQRFLPLDEIDPNRGYPNPPKARGLSAALKNALLQTALQHDIIIDLHTFTRPCLSAGLLLPHISPERQSRAQAILAALGVDCCIRMNLAGEEQRVDSALGSLLARQGKIFVVAEYPPVRQVTASDIACFSEGLAAALGMAGLFSPPLRPQGRLPLFERQQIISERTGLFEPALQLGATVAINQRLGDIIDVQTLRRAPLVSPYAGILTELADRQLYRFGDKLATIGKPIGNSAV